MHRRPGARTLGAEVGIVHQSHQPAQIWAAAPAPRPRSGGTLGLGAFGKKPTQSSVTGRGLHRQNHVMPRLTRRRARRGQVEGRADH